MNVKKIFKFFSFLFIMLSGIFCSTNNVSAAATQGDIISGKYVSGPYYVIHEKKDGSHMWLQAQFINRSSDGQFVYCVQPYFRIKEDNTYNITTEDYAAVLNMSQESWEQISRLAYYGYGYKDSNYDHTSEKWYIATQMVIWKIADPSIDSYFTNTLKGTRNDNILKAEMDEVIALANSHKVLPSFSNVPNQMTIGQTININDNKNVLKNFDITDVKNGKVEKNNNELSITATGVGNLSFNIIKLGNRYGHAIELYYASDSQNVMHVGNIDPAKMELNIKVNGGKVQINKVDSETNSAVAQGEGLLNNAKYGIYDNNSNLIQTLTTNTNGYAISDYLPNIGTFYIQEISPSTGYKIDNEKHYFEITTNNLLATVTSKEEVIKGKIKVTKNDSDTKTCKAQGEATLTGAKYGVYDKNNNLVDTLTIGDDCTAISKDLPYGNYKIKELNASTGYYIDTNVYSANINEVKTINVTSSEKVITTKVKVTKNDSETKACTAQGDASLTGAKYGVYDHKGNLVDTIITGNDCTATSKDLPFGRYSVKELEPSEGYYLDKNVYSINVINDTLITITSYEDVIKNYISILKQYNYVNGQTTFLNAEANITFDIFNSKGNKYSSITTDKNGYATINLPYGVWKFHQVNSTTGYEKIYDFYVTVNRESKLEQYYNILNNALSAYLQITKVDSETGKTIELADTTFKIYNSDTKQYVSQYVGGKVISEFKTDEKGIVITPLKLESGNYKIVEIKSPSGYLINQNGIDFTIGNDTHFNYTTYGAFVVAEFKDTAIKGQIEVNKYGEKFVADNGSYKYEQKDLSDVEFNIYAEEDILSADKNYLYYNKGDLVETIKTDKTGYAISSKLPLGKYYIVETKTQENYILNTERYSFELTEIDNRTPIVYKSYSDLNKYKKGTIDFTKTDLVDGQTIANTKIEIYTENDELVFSGITDKDGKIVITDLPVNTKFYIIESEPATGYVITDEKVYFMIKDNGEIVKAEMKNKPITSTLEFTKSDLSTDEALPDTLIEIYNEKDELVFSGRTDKEGKITIENIRYGKYYILEKEAPEGYTLNTEKMYFEVKKDGEIIKSNMKDKKITSTLVFTKTDVSTQEALPNTVIEIYNEKDELIFSGKTDENGQIIIDELEYGKYYILEKEAPEGYTLNPEKMYFEVKEDGEIIRCTMTDDKIIVEVPNTDSNNNIVGISITLMVFATGVVIYEEIKKRKNKKK